MNAITKIEEAVPIYDIAPRSQLVIDGIEYAYAERLPGGHRCQSAWNVDPRSAPKIDPSVSLIAVAVGAEP